MEELITKVNNEIHIKFDVTPEELKIIDNEKEIILGKNVMTNEFVFASKEDALRYYNKQLENCERGIPEFEKKANELEDEVHNNKIFEDLYKLKGKLDTSKLKGKYKVLDEYLNKSIQYNYCLNQIKLRTRDADKFKSMIKTIEAL